MFPGIESVSAVQVVFQQSCFQLCNESNRGNGTTIGKVKNTLCSKLVLQKNGKLIALNSTFES